MIFNILTRGESNKAETFPGIGGKKKQFTLLISNFQDNKQVWKKKLFPSIASGITQHAKPIVKALIPGDHLMLDPCQHTYWSCDPSGHWGFQVYKRESMRGLTDVQPVKQFPIHPSIILLASYRTHTIHCHTLTPRGYLEPPVDLNFYVFGWGPHYKARSVGIRPMTFLLWGDGAIHNPSMRRAPYNLCWPSTEWELAASFSENYLRTGSLITGSSTWV